MLNLKQLLILPVVLCALSVTQVLCHADPVADWHMFERAVRDGTLAKPEAHIQLPSVVNNLHTSYVVQISAPPMRWTFPVQGYDLRAVNRSDFKPHSRYGPKNVKGYDFFDGNQHGGHPAFDICIHDKNHDLRDDRTGKLVNAVAMTDAIVVSVCREWSTNKLLRGGNYVWLYNPSINYFFYYAHLNEVLVEEGTLLKAGDVVGTIGRTGLLASRKASPTHVHLMVLKYYNGKMIPIDYYAHLQ
ncbi:MAG: M23 family metallopeptidase [Endomicrobiales bacterium]|jgi:hypothetical protein